jgi:chorismate mutase
VSSTASPSAASDLTSLRAEIDDLDERMHGLLMARGDIIDRLIEIKRRQGGGSAFRPDREAAMMRRLVGRHRGLLPLDTVESIWRIIISTFTYEQAPYSVHGDLSGGDAAMRDSARFHFGFTVKYRGQKSAAEVIEAVRASGTDLGLVRMDGGAAAGAWWRRLADPAAPKIIARLPFVERPDHPAGTPVFVIANPLPEAAARDQIVYELALERWRESIRGALAEHGVEMIESASTEFGLSLLLSAPAAIGPARLAAIAQTADPGEARVAELGSHANRFDVAAGRLQERARP